MNVILNFIKNYGTVGIIIFGLFIAIMLIANGIKLSDRKKRIEDALLRKDTKYYIDAVNKELTEQEDENTIATPDKIRAMVTEFNHVCSWHDILVQFIPIFPLLGILGTVAGLMLEVQSGDIVSMLGSLNTALDTTFWGLFFAIILKAIEALLNSQMINSVEVMLDDFDKKMGLAEMFQSIQNEK